MFSKIYEPPKRLKEFVNEYSKEAPTKDTLGIIMRAYHRAKEAVTNSYEQKINTMFYATMGSLMLNAAAIGYFSLEWHQTNKAIPKNASANIVQSYLENTYQLEQTTSLLNDMKKELPQNDNEIQVLESIIQNHNILGERYREDHIVQEYNSSKEKLRQDDLVNKGGFAVFSVLFIWSFVFGNRGMSVLAKKRNKSLELLDATYTQKKTSMLSEYTLQELENMGS